MFEDRSTASEVQVKFVALKYDQKRAGCTITRTRLETEKGTRGPPMGGLNSSTCCNGTTLFELGR